MNGTQTDRFVESNMGLVHLCANRFRNRGIEYDDLFGAGCVGLIKAANGFDESRGVKFSTYAVPVIMGEIKGLFRNGGIRKTRAEVEAENQQKNTEYMEAVGNAIDEAAGDAEELPFEEAVAAAETVPKPDLQKPPRRTRKERQTEQAANIPDGTDNTDFENVVLKEDTYFHDIENDNYLLKHKGDAVDLVIDGQVVMKQITKEEFIEGCNRISQGKSEQNPVEGVMNPPEAPARGQRRRRTR